MINWQKRELPEIIFTYIRFLVPVLLIIFRILLIRDFCEGSDLFNYLTQGQISIYMNLVQFQAVFQHFSTRVRQLFWLGILIIENHSDRLHNKIVSVKQFHGLNSIRGSCLKCCIITFKEFKSLR